MKEQMIRIKLWDGYESVQLTGNASATTVQVFRNDKVEFIHRDAVHPEDIHRLPGEYGNPAEAVDVPFLIPDDYLTFCENGHLRWLINRVWRRLPAVDRVVLNSLLRNIIDHGTNNFMEHYLLGSQTRLVNKTPVQWGREVNHTVFLMEATELATDEAVMFVIAREFARIVLRQPQLFATAGALINDETDSFYTEYLVSQVRWGRDHAALQAVLWGFEEERQAYVAERPNDGRRQWFQAQRPFAA